MGEAVTTEFIKKKKKMHRVKKYMNIPKIVTPMIVKRVIPSYLLTVSTCW